MLSKAGNETYKYDVYNRLVKYSLDDGSKSESYTYDAEGVRRSKVTTSGDNVQSIWFVSDTSNELSRTVAETNENGDVLAIYSWGDTLLSQTREDGTSTYLYDGYGNVRGLLDEKGTLTDTYAYNAYGELTERTGETENHYLYTGEYYDGTTNLYYLRARYMNPSTGTFISMDTYQGDMYEPVTLHKYLYANANPVKYSDPSGMFSLAEMNCASAMSAMWQNRYTMMGLSVLTGVTNAAFETVCGGTPEEIMGAFQEGFIVGAGLSLFVCALVLFNVIALVQATALIATSVFATGIATVAMLVVFIVESVMSGETQRSKIYASLLVLAILGTAIGYGACAEVSVIGDSGSHSVSTGEIAKYARGCNVGDLEMSRTVQNHMNEVVKRGPYAGQLSRPYIDSNGTRLLLKEIMQAVAPVSDTILEKGLRWDVAGTFRGTSGTWELVVDTSTNVIVHFNFVAQ